MTQNDDFTQWLQLKRDEREAQARRDQLRMWQEPGESLAATQKRIEALLQTLCTGPLTAEQACNRAPSDHEVQCGQQCL